MVMSVLWLNYPLTTEALSGGGGGAQAQRRENSLDFFFFFFWSKIFLGCGGVQLFTGGGGGPNANFYLI